MTELGVGKAALHPRLDFVLTERSRIFFSQEILTIYNVCSMVYIWVKMTFSGMTAQVYNRLLLQVPSKLQNYGVINNPFWSYRTSLLMCIDNFTESLMTFEAERFQDGPYKWTA